MLSKIKPRLSYGNVVATLALFIALGGVSYAAVKINGSQIKNHSIPSSKVKKSFTAPKAKVAKSTTTLSLPAASGPDQHSLARLGPVTAAGESANSGTLFPLAVGQSVDIISRPPFTITATCVDDGNGAYTVSLSGKSSEDGLIAGNNPGISHVAGEAVPLASRTSKDAESVYTTPGDLFSPNSGASLSLGPATLSTHITGLGDCGVSTYAIG
jgi:hypothetical protein